MKQQKKHFQWRAAVLAVMTSILLSGCSMTGLDAQALMHPPRPTGERADIYALLEAKAGGNFTLKYPATGEHRSAIICHNLSGDSHPEALALYQRGENDTAVNILFSAKEGNKWKEIGTFSNPAAQVDRVCFGDLNGDGYDEAIVGWGSSAGSASMMSVFYYKNGRMNELKLGQTYNEVAVADFDGDGKKEIFTASIPADSQQQCTGSLFRLNGDALQLMGSIRLDTGIAKFSGLLTGSVSRGQPGVLLDCMQTNSRTLTELIYWDKTKKTLCAPLYNPQSPQQNVTIRDMAVASGDINSDGILEFPIVTRLPGYTGAAADDVGNEVQWTRLESGKGNYTQVSSMIINARDGYRFVLPGKWKDTITTKQDVNARRLTFSAFDSNKGTVGSTLMTVQIFTNSEWNSGKKTSGYRQVLSSGSLIVAVSIPTQKNALSISFDVAKKCFQLITADT